MHRFILSAIAALTLTATASAAQGVFAPDPTGAVSAEGRYAPTPLTETAALFAGAVSKESDPRIAVWIALQKAGDLDGLIAATLADLQSPDPHPASSHVWAWAQWARGSLGPTQMPDLPEGLEDRLELAALVMRAEFLERDDLLADLAEVTLARDTADYWPDYEIAYAACGVLQRDLCLRIGQRLVETFPNDFGAAFLVGANFAYESDGIHAWLNSVPGLADSAGGALIRAILERPNLSTAEIRELAKAWLEVAPDDPNALRRLGGQEADMWRHEDALALYQREEDAYPFRDAAKRIGRELSVLRRFDEAEAVAENWVLRAHPENRRAGWVEAVKLGMFRAAGELGRARDVGLNGIEAAPGLRVLRLNFAKSLQDEGFHDEAARMIAPVLNDDATDYAAAAIHADAMSRDDRPHDALAAAETYRKAGGKPNPDLYDAERRAYGSLGDKAAIQSLFDRMMTELPDAHRVAGNVAYEMDRQKLHTEAFDIIRNALKSAPASNWRLARLVDYAERAGRMPEAAAFLEALVARHPYLDEAWSQLGRATGQGLSIWDRARTAVPRESFPEIRRAKALAKAAPQDWPAIQDLLKAGISRLERDGAAPGALAEMLAEKAWQINDAVFDGHVYDRELLFGALDEAEQALSLGLARDEYWDLRYYLLSRIGASRELSVAALKRAEAFPDKLSTVTHLFNGDVAENLGSPATGFIRYHRFVRRQPRNSERLLGFAHRHNKWGGSSVVALAYLEEVKKWDPEMSVKVETEHAYKMLGAYKRHYEEQYNNDFSISRSNLYIDWFETARADTIKPQPTIKTLDLDAMKVVQIMPDGIEWQAQYHPVTGRLTRFRAGGVAGGLDYNEYGDATRMWIGDRIEFRLVYADRKPDRPGGSIAELHQADGPSISFEYNDAGNPTRIDVAGLGRLLVSYDETGEMDGVRSETPDGKEAGIEISDAVTAAFQDFQTVLQSIRDLQQGNFDNLRLDDPEIDDLEARLSLALYDDDTSATEIARLSLELGEILLERLGDLPGHAERAEELFTEIYEGAIILEEDIAAGDLQPDPADLAERREIAIRAAGRWRDLMQATRPDGLPHNLFGRWTDMREWIDGMDSDAPAVIGARAEFLAANAGNMLKPLSDLGWLQASHLTNPGFWHSYLRSEVYPRLLVDLGLQMNDILIRENGDIVVAADRGLAVFRRGFWEWFGYDRQRGRFSASLDFSALEGFSNAVSLAEDESGRLWIGTRAGLVMLDKDYSDPARVWQSGERDFIEGPIEAVAENSGRLAIGNSSGLAIMELDGLSIEQRSDRPVEALRAARHGFLVMGPDGLRYHDKAAEHPLTDYRVTDAIAPSNNAGVYILTGERLMHASWPDLIAGNDDGAGEWSFQPVEGQESIGGTAPPLGLAWLRALPGRDRLTVLTDQGGSVMGRSGFESFSEPGQDRPSAFLKVAAQGEQVFVLTSNGVAAVTGGQARQFYDDRVHDLLTVPERGATLIATGYGIDQIDHDDPAAGPQPFADISARILRTGPDGAVISHDGNSVVRFAADGGTETLFRADQTVPTEYGQAPIRDLLAASDGSVWAIAGASAFRWQAGGDLREFTIFDAEPDYPVWSDSLHAIHEAPDGRILLVASDDGHRSFRNRSLSGGLFEFDGTGFVPAGIDLAGSWFATSLTAMPDGTAILGTSDGFARLSSDGLTSFRLADDASYLAMRDSHPALYLGTRGARLGDDLWLFGSAAGVAARKGQTWFYPDRLNWMLPAQDYANYGARVIHAVETDSAGRVYMATDRGLTVHDPQGAGPESFLISEARSDFAFAALEQNQMRAVNDVLLDALPKDSEAGRLAASVRKSKRQVAALEEQLDHAKQAGDGSQEKIEKQLLRVRQRDLALLAGLETQQPMLFNMLQLNPLDLRALARKLPEGVVVAQYLPTDSKLYINLVSRDGEVLREVEIGKEELDQTVRATVEALAAQARGQLRGFDLGGTSDAEPTTAAESPEPQQADALPQDTTERLHWLYQQLLRPIENDIPAEASLVVSPAGVLSYLPFAALVREIREEGPVYAVERFDLAVAPSMFALETMIDALPSAGLSQLVFADPDGSLPAARQEGQAIAGLLEQDSLVELRVGAEATYEDLQTYGGDAQFIHLATHGKLDPSAPKDSYLLLADNRRMDIPQIMTLPLSEAELVFLSACESGLGTDGLEYRTLSHTFVHAGARAVIATLWKVDDDATRKLAEAFYDAKLDWLGNAAALSTAQRSMIAAGGNHARPGYWAGVTLFGAP